MKHFNFERRESDTYLGVLTKIWPIPKLHLLDVKRPELRLLSELVMGASDSVSSSSDKREPPGNGNETETLYFET